jgi:hypothetical protein
VVIIIGQVSLPGRETDNWAGTTVGIEVDGPSAEPMSTTTDSTGKFMLSGVPSGTFTAIKADASGYLPAVCAAPRITPPEITLTTMALLSGDINDDDAVDITDAVAIGLEFGAIGSTVPADINRSGNVDVLDVILVGVNFGEGTQTWHCLEE